MTQEYALIGIENPLLDIIGIQFLAAWLFIISQCPDGDARGVQAKEK